MDTLDSSDFFESSVTLEKSHIEEGYADGYKQGLVTGRQDGYEVGLKHGFESGEELGFYRGLVDVWLASIRIEPNCFSPRIRKAIQQIKELLEKYPLMDPEDESKDDVLEGIRLKFRAVCATLGVRLEYSGYPNRLVTVIRRTKMLKLSLACCKVYISESRNKVALESIERAAQLFPEARIVNKFEDDSYNRVGYTLVSKMAPNLPSDLCPLQKAVFAIVKSAFEVVDLNMHRGSHPRLGVDHICFHPLANSSLEQAASLARSLASDVGATLQVPTFLYGAAHNKGRTLALTRRDLGYFKPNTHGNIWAGGANSEHLPLDPDEGPNQVDKSKGVVVIGTTKWVDNYNIPIFSTDISAVRRIAKRTSERGGGLSFVQAMGLGHGKGLTEIACNLLNPSLVGGDKVQVEVERLAKEEGLVAGIGYYTDFSQEKVVETFLQLEH